MNKFYSNLFLLSLMVIITFSQEPESSSDTTPSSDDNTSASDTTPSSDDNTSASDTTPSPDNTPVSDSNPSSDSKTPSNTKSDFCSKADPNVKYMFEIKSKIYFGNESNVWKLDVTVPSKPTVLQPEFKDIFGQSDFNSIKSSLYFDHKIQCIPLKNCTDIEKLKGKVFVFGARLYENITEYKTYSVQNDDTFQEIKSDEEMPFGMKTSGVMDKEIWLGMNENFWYKSFTFDEKNQTIYMVVDLMGNDIIYTNLYSTNLEKFGPEREWRDRRLERSYTGLMSRDGVIFGLFDNEIYFVSNDTKIKSMKWFFNCNPSDPSILMNVPTISPPIHEENGSAEPTLKPTSEAKKSSMVFVILSIVLIIIAIIIAIICCLFCCNKSKKDRPKNEKSTTGSKVHSGLSSKSTSSAISVRSKEVD